MIYSATRDMRSGIGDILEGEDQPSSTRPQQTPFQMSFFKKDTLEKELRALFTSPMEKEDKKRMSLRLYNWLRLFVGRRRRSCG